MTSMATGDGFAQTSAVSESGMLVSNVPSHLRLVREGSAGGWMPLPSSKLMMVEARWLNG